MAAVLSAPVLAFPDTGVWHGMRPFLIQAVAFGSLALMLARLSWSVEGLRSFLTTGPNLALILFIGWSSLSFAVMTPVEGRGRAIALAELMRLAAGAAIYFAVVYRSNSRDHLKLAALLLLVGGVLASAAGMLSAGMSKSDGATGAYGNRQLLAAFLVLLLPVAIVFAQTGEKFIRPLFATTAALRCLLATVATVMLAATLLLTNNRSSWLGSIVGLLVITALLLRTRKRREERKLHWIASPLVALACLVLFLVLLGTESGVVERARTFTAPTQIGSFQQRLQLWSICKEMIRERPLMGFGVGSFPMKAGDYSEALATRKDEQTVAASDADTIGVPSAPQVEQVGASLSSLPHNEYLQLAAEQGLVGLALHLGVLVGFFYRGIRVLPQVAKISRTRKLMLIAAMGAIAAQCVDAIGNPAWRFGDVSPLFWLMLGLGMAATRTSQECRAVNDEIGLRTLSLTWCDFTHLGRRGVFGVLALFLVTLSFVETKASLLESYVVVPIVVGTSAVAVIVIPKPAPSPTPSQIQTPSMTSEIIATSGPAFPAIFNMSNFSVEAFVQGGWPMVICYELESNSTATLTIGDGKHSFVIQLPSTQDQPGEVIRQIPTEFGPAPVVGVLSFNALKDGPEPREFARFFPCGLGLGPRAVGSMVIDRLEFGPRNINTKRKEEATYKFHASSDFSWVRADFRLVTKTRRGYRAQTVRSEDLKNGISRDAVIDQKWDGKNGQGKISPGPYQFQVRAWESDANWVFAARNQTVRVE